MAIFVCAADESYDSGHFFYSGWAAPLDTWDGDLSRAWRERVLDGPPRLPYLHMTEIRDWNWQAEHGLKPWQADRRIDEAANVLCSTGRLCPVSFGLQLREYESIIKSQFKRHLGSLEPDYLCFQWFAFTQLQWLYEWCEGEVERVDFWVEQNGRISKSMANFHSQLADGVRYIGREYLMSLIGEFRVVEKDCIATQAADMLGWHARNARRHKLDAAGWTRYRKMTAAAAKGTQKGRFGHYGTMRTEDMQNLAARFAARLAGEKAAKNESQIVVRTT